MLSRDDVAPPGREEQVKALKHAKGVDNPFAVAWASYNAGDEMEYDDDMDDLHQHEGHAVAAGHHAHGSAGDEESLLDESETAAPKDPPAKGVLFGEHSMLHDPDPVEEDSYLDDDELFK